MFSYLKVSVKGCDSEICRDDETIRRKQSLRMIIPEATVNYENETEQAVEWFPKSHLSLRLDPN